MIEIYNGADSLTMMDGKTYDASQLAESPQYQMLTQYKSVIWRADDGAVFRWRFFDNVLGLLSDTELEQYSAGSLDDSQVLAIVEERFGYISPTTDELSDAVIEVSTETAQNTSDIADIMDAIIEMTNLPA